MKKTLLIFILFVCVAVQAEETVVLSKKNCSILKSGKSYPLNARVKIVKSFPDFKVKVVKNFPQLDIRIVDHSPSCCEWQFVESFPDFTIQYVESFPDFTIRFVKSFPSVK